MANRSQGFVQFLAPGGLVLRALRLAGFVALAAAAVAVAFLGAGASAAG